jgi:uncharacterized protein YyaL (SSP411 family)
MAQSKTSETRKPNRLIHETSPYLLEHAYNPVDWYPWGDEAFRKAKTENKPIFLSIGYSSCHWCHVLRKESFEDSEVAKFLNENFVSIKVDREERPDIDELYMKAVMSITGSGGWPLTVFLTPSLEPFFGGTYFPSTPRYGMPSFINVARGVAGSWRNERKSIVESAKQMKESLGQMYDYHKVPNSPLTGAILDECYNSLAGSFDQSNGGFSDYPKFPTPSNLFFLMRYFKTKKLKLALGMVTKTLDSMMGGGIYDQIGGGFHRYSTDRYWLVPHFEKMLYDNALLATAYTEAFLLTKNEEYARIANETLSWAIREMRSNDGGFYASQDADSKDGEGFFYTWSPQDVQAALHSEKSMIAPILNFFSITNEGNTDGGKTILTTKPTEIVTKEFGIKIEEFTEILINSKKAMLEYRNKRSRPPTDDKIITSWNGLMVTALSKAYMAFGDETYLRDATTTADSILRRSHTGNSLRLSRSFRDGEERGEGVLEDYSFFANGLIDLYEASFDPKYLKSAISLCEAMLSDFEDTRGALCLTRKDSKNLIVRVKEGYDGAIPSGNSIAALVLMRLAEICAREDFRNSARDIFETFQEPILAQPASFTQMLSALHFLVSGPKEIVVSGDLASKDTKELVGIIRSRFLPNSVFLFSSREIEDVTPLVHGRIGESGEVAKVFVCSNFTCSLPTSSKEQLIEMLEN